MISLLSRFLIRDRKNTADPAVRRAYGVLCGAVGILLNLLAFAGKLAVGVLSGSVAVSADAFNNLSDAGSSFITLLGFRLAGIEPDRRHPFGHGRFEYLSGLVVSILILMMGVELAQSGVRQILRPEPVTFTLLTAVVLLASICLKGYMYFYNHRMGTVLDSEAMQATARDSLADTLSTAAVLLSGIVGQLTDLHIDGWCGLLVAAFILWSGVSALKETADPLLGKPPSPEFVREIKTLVLAHPEIRGIHDLVVHDYGPGRCMISLHAEVPADRDIVTAHDEIDNVEKELKAKLGCETVIHMDPVVTSDKLTLETQEKVQALAACIDEAITIHDFRMVAGPTHVNVIFDAVVPVQFRLSDEETAEKLCRAVQVLDGSYHAAVNVERSYL